MYFQMFIGTNKYPVVPKKKVLIYTRKYQKFPLVREIQKGIHMYYKVSKHTLFFIKVPKRKHLYKKVPEGGHRHMAQFTQG